MTKKERRGKREQSNGRRFADKQTFSVQLGMALVNLSGAPAKTAIRYGAMIWGLVEFGRIVVEVVRELKGEITLADIKIQMGAALSVNTEAGTCLINGLLKYSTLGATLTTAIAVLYVYRERMLRNQIIREKAAQIVALEKALDKHRSSSGLTSTGNTNPEDL